MTKISAFLFALIFILAGTTNAQMDVQDLYSEIEAGHVKLGEVNGNGNSSGAAVEGYLFNETSIEKNISINLKQPIFFSNGRAGQNMIAMRVFYHNGGFFKSGQKSFISLQPKEKKKIVFIAYCVDFDKDNPSDSDTFTISSVPVNIKYVVERIGEHARKNPSVNITVAAQAAIWLTQGKSMAEIRKKFAVSPSDEQLARTFIKK